MKKLDEFRILTWFTSKLGGPSRLNIVSHLMVRKFFQYEICYPLTDDPSLD